jgi:hypothetical protein
MIETIAVCTIVGGVILFAVRSLRRTLSGKNDACGCGTKTCPTSTCCNQWGVGREKADK